MTDSKKPVIVISCGNPESPEIRTKLLVQFIHQHGGIPVLADHSKPEHIAKLVEAADGIIVQGNAFAPESLRFTGQSRGFASKLGDGSEITFMAGEDQRTRIQRADGKAVFYPGRLLPVPASALNSPQAPVAEGWYLADPQRAGMLIDPVTLEAYPLDQAGRVNQLVENPAEFFHPMLAFKPDEHRRGHYEQALLLRAEGQGAKPLAEVRDSSNLPVLAICGGFQELAGLHGAKFHPVIEEDVEQHLPREKQVRHYNRDMKRFKQIETDVRKKVEEGMHIGHLPAFSPSAAVHVLSGALRKILGVEVFRPMSTHVTGVAADSLPDELELTAISPNDNIAEGFRFKDPRNPERFFHAVQFHPDGFQTPQDFKLLEELMDQAKARAAAKPKGVPAVPKELLKNPIVAAAIDQIKDLPPEQPLQESIAWQVLVQEAVRSGRIAAESVPASLR